MVTATSIEARIVLALENAVLPVAQAAGLAIAAPGVVFTPSGTSPYLRVTIAKNTPINVSLSGGREPIRQGILLVTACYPVGAGILPATETAAAVRDAFKFNTKIPFTGGFVKICEEPSLQGDMIDGVYVEIPCVVKWTAFA
jgi:hypothetical protein